MAFEKGIAIRELALRPKRPHAASTFASLEEVQQCRADLGDRRATAWRYIEFRLAGPAAELVRLEKHHGIQPDDPVRWGFRKRWLDRRWAEPSADFDTAYSLAVGWMFLKTPEAVRRYIEDRAERIREAFSYHAAWRQIERLAAELVRKSRLNAEEVLSVLTQN